jgi:hypothetical protein
VRSSIESTNHAVRHAQAIAVDSAVLSLVKLPALLVHRSTVRKVLHIIGIVDVPGEIPVDDVVLDA